MGAIMHSAVLALLILALSNHADCNFLVGVSKYDITGPVADVNLMEEFSGLYTADNTAISGTHTHASPAGFLQYVLYDITSLGFIRQTFDAMVDGIVQSIRQAHASLQPGQLLFNSGELLDANINRSPGAYLANPEQERALYAHDVEKQMDLLRVEDSSGRGLGLLHWFAVHCTSMNNTNRLISGDNKGVAEQMAEAWAREQPPDRISGSFVAAAVQSSVGDTSPNVLGAFCIDTGDPCDNPTSTCRGRNEMCHGRGPGWPDDTKSTIIIGSRQFEKSKELYLQAQEEVVGAVDYRHKYLDMANITTCASNWTRAGRTCPAALGFSFAAGTTDGPGQFDFTQADTRGTAFWKLVSAFLHKPTQQQQECHAPKPILIDAGNVHLPYDWTPHITEISIFRAGPLVILCAPAEFTTMAGRRLKRAIYATVRGAWGDGVHIVLSGLTNTYASYVTTYEEYSVQRYEGAFTLFGPHTLDAYIQEFVALAEAMVKGDTVESTVQPPDMYSQQISLLLGVVADAVPVGAQFGDVVSDANSSYAVGDVVSVTFRSGCPRNNLHTNGTFLLVERYQAQEGQPDAGEWVPVHTDDDLCTKFKWDRPYMLSAESFATVQWDIPQGTLPGGYRIRHFGDHKHVLGTLHAYEGTSRLFEVVASGSEQGSEVVPCHSKPGNRQNEEACFRRKPWLERSSCQHTTLVCNEHHCGPTGMDCSDSTGAVFASGIRWLHRLWQGMMEWFMAV